MKDKTIAEGIKKQELNLFVIFVIQSQNLLMVLFVKLIKPILII